MRTKSIVSVSSPIQQTFVGAAALLIAYGLIAPKKVRAALVVSSINQTIHLGESLNIDLNNDSVTDYILSISGEDPFTDGQIKDPLSGEEGVILGFISVDGDTGFATKLSAGDTVDVDLFNGTTADNDSFAKLYDSAGEGPWSTVGDHGYLGLVLFTDDSYSEVRYGWLEVTRGSLTVDKMGFETTPFTPAPIPVPEPASAALFGLALLGTVVRRRVDSIGLPLSFPSGRG